MCPVAAESNENNLGNNNEISDSEDEDKGLGNIKLGPKGIYTEDSIRVYLQEIGRIRPVSYTHLTLPTR